MNKADIITQMQRYAKQIYDRAMMGQKPGAALANYMRTLRELDETRANQFARDLDACSETNS